MIPKVIHYCWFGKNPRGELMRRCIESWKRFCPDYQIVEWNESNFDVDCIPYLAEAYRGKKYAHVTDYARLKILYENGGVYLDTDVELIDSLDPFLADRAFFAMQKPGEVATGLGFGAEAGAPILRELMRNYEGKLQNDSAQFFRETCVVIDKAVFERHGIRRENVLQRLGDAVIYPMDYFNPKDYETDELTMTENTVSIHHYSRSWHDSCERIICETYRALIRAYEPAEAKRRFDKWYQKNRIRLLLKRYGFMGVIRMSFKRIMCKRGSL